MMQKTKMRKSLSLEKVGNIQLSVGTFSSKSPKVFYISGCSWLECAEANNYKKALEYIKTRMHKRIIKRLQEIDSLDSNYIFDFDLTANNMKLGIAKFFKFMIFLRQKGEIRSLEKLKSLANATILQEIEQMINDFEECGFKCIMK